MSARPIIQTYRLASLHEAATARLKNPKNDRYKELYLQNREIGEKVYNAVLDAVGFKMQQGLNSKAMKCKVCCKQFDAERIKNDLPKKGKSPTR